MLAEILRFGAPEPTRGMNRLDDQHSSANTSIRPANDAGSPPSLAASPPTMVPSRIARKVAPSTSALAAGSSERCRRSGRMPYLIGPNSEPITPKPNSATNRIGTECITKPAIGDHRDPDLGELQPLRDHRLVVAVGHLAAERRQEEVGRDEYRRRQRDRATRRAEPPILNRIRNTSAFLRKLSLNAEKNWHQNSGAKRRDNSRGFGSAIVQNLC